MMSKPNTDLLSPPPKKEYSIAARVPGYTSCPLHQFQRCRHLHQDLNVLEGSARGELSLAKLKLSNTMIAFSRRPTPYEYVNQSTLIVEKILRTNHRLVKAPTHPKTKRMAKLIKNMYPK